MQNTLARVLNQKRRSLIVIFRSPVAQTLKARVKIVDRLTESAKITLDVRQVKNPLRKKSSFWT
jgi:vacuolar-type H+-ATPase subunit D/Vma8